MFCYLVFLSSLKVPYHIEGDQPSYLTIAGLVFTSLSEPLIEYATTCLNFIYPPISALIFVIFNTNHDLICFCFKVKNVKIALG